MKRAALVITDADTTVVTTTAPDGFSIVFKTLDTSEQLLVDLRRLAEPRWNDYPDEVETKARVRALLLKEGGAS